MDFYELVDQVVQLLQQRDRLTYRSLKLQFKLDDETLEALKDELLFSHPVVDEAGRGLVWTGEAGTTPEVTSAPPAQPEVPQEAQPAQVESPPTEPRSLDAERRQLTVMFIDIVESTSLSSQLDPEDYREVVRSYQATCSEVIQRYDGHVAQLLGDGLLVYFGYPQAHEDDAQRAVRAGLGIIEAIEVLNTRLEQDKGIQLAVRLGIHTGLVVVGEMGGAGRQEQLALGEVPNIASRIQGISAPNTVAISATTFQLVEGYFTCQDLGEQTLRGIEPPISVYRVFQESGAQSRLDIVTTRGLTPLVGRESEVTLLLERWNQVKEGQGQVVLLSGEGGIGKSRLVQVLKEHVTGESHTRLECRSSPYYQNTALYPMTDLLQRAWQFHADDTPEQRLEQLERELSQYRLPLEETVPLFATLLSLPLSEDRYPPLNWTPQRQRQKTLETIVAMLLELSEQQPILFVIEDNHWLDATSLELLGLLIDQTPTASILTLLTSRPEFQPPWGNRSYLTQVTLNRLSRTHVARMAEHVVGGKSLPAEILDQIIEKTDGVPLFVEELTKAILESGHLKETDEHYELTEPLPSLVIPATLQDSLMARLDRLVTAKGVAQMGATIGRQFPYALLLAIAQVDEATLQRELSHLVEAELVYQRGLPPHATYTFKHALVQDAALRSLLNITRQQYHQRIATVLETQFPETGETQPELLAHHFTEAGLAEQAVHAWQRAGQRANAHSAYEEAIGHLTKGLELLSTQPDTPERLQQELVLLTSLGLALSVTKGLAAVEVEQTFNRAWEICQHVEADPQLLRVLQGLGAFYAGQGALQKALEVEEQRLTLAQCQHDSTSLVAAHSGLGVILFHMGAFASARAHLEQSLSFPNAKQHRVPSHFMSFVLWHFGYPDQALRWSREALALARELSRPFTLAGSLCYAAVCHASRREWDVVYEQAEAAMVLATEAGFPHWAAVGMLVQGWAMVELGRGEAGIAQLRQGLTAHLATGAELARPTYLVWLAQAYWKAGDVAEGLTVLAEALEVMERNGERVGEARLYRLKGELLRHADGGMRMAALTPEDCFQKALDVARLQQAKSLELCAATSLARLWQSQDKRQDAYDLLAPVYSWFTEGFDTADLQEAKALLDELSLR